MAAAATRRSGVRRRRARRGRADAIVPAAVGSEGGVFADAWRGAAGVRCLLIRDRAAAVLIWGLSLPKVGKGDAQGAGRRRWGGLRIRALGGDAARLPGGQLHPVRGFLGIANVRPAPSISVMAPGWAEAALAVMLGLLADATWR
jgi:hypothetical protein